MECNLGWNHTRDFKIERARSASSIWNQVWFQTKIARHEVQLPLYYIHFEITQMQDLANSNILLMQYWAGLKLKSSILVGGEGGSKSFKNKSCKIWHMILFVFHFPAIWSVNLNKPWNLIRCFVINWDILLTLIIDGSEWLSARSLNGFKEKSVVTVIELEFVSPNQCRRFFFIKSVHALFSSHVLSNW